MSDETRPGQDDGRPSQKEAMLSGELYLADDPELAADALHAAVLSERYNATSAADPEARRAVLAELLGEVGEEVDVRPPLRVDYGYQTTVGPRTFVNFGAVFLDVARITIGADVQMGPNVQLLTRPTRSTPNRVAPSGRRPCRSPSATTCGWAAG